MFGVAKLVGVARAFNKRCASALRSRILSIERWSVVATACAGGCGCAGAATCESGGTDEGRITRGVGVEGVCCGVAVCCGRGDGVGAGVRCTTPVELCGWGGLTVRGRVPAGGAPVAGVCDWAYAGADAATTSSSNEKMGPLFIIKILALAKKVFGRAP